MHKGQTVSYEIFVSIFMLSILFLSFLNSLTMLQATEQNFLAYEPMQKATYFVLQNLTRTPGIPSNWDQNLDINYLGLCKENMPNVIDTNKFQKFLTLDYNTAKQLLRISEYEFYLKLSYSTTTITYGSSPTTATKTVSMQKVVDFNSQPALLRVTLYAE